MTQYLPSGNETGTDSLNPVAAHVMEASDTMADLKIFWGTEICRLEYLIHLMDTGRIKDERRKARRAAQAAEGAPRTP